MGDGALMRAEWYWRDGTPAVTAGLWESVDREEWGRQMRLVDEKLRDFEYKRVARTEWKSGPTRVFVSTVWLGLDHSWDESGAPLIFESMVFIEGHGDEQDRYSTESEAIAGHVAMLIKTREQYPTGIMGWVRWVERSYQKWREKWIGAGSSGS